MVETVSAQPLARESTGTAPVLKLEPGTEVKARVEANLPGGVVRLAAADAKVDLRIPSPLPVGAEVTVSVSGSRQQPAIQISTSNPDAPADAGAQKTAPSQPAATSGNASAAQVSVTRAAALAHLVQAEGAQARTSAQGGGSASGAPPAVGGDGAPRSAQPPEGVGRQAVRPTIPGAPQTPGGAATVSRPESALPAQTTVVSGAARQIANPGQSPQPTGGGQATGQNAAASLLAVASSSGTVAPNAPASAPVASPAVGAGLPAGASANTVTNAQTTPATQPAAGQPAKGQPGTLPGGGPASPGAGAPAGSGGSVPAGNSAVTTPAGTAANPVAGGVAPAATGAAAQPGAAPAAQVGGQFAAQVSGQPSVPVPAATLASGPLGAPASVQASVQATGQDPNLVPARSQSGTVTGAGSAAATPAGAAQSQAGAASGPAGASTSSMSASQVAPSAPPGATPSVAASLAGTSPAPPSGGANEPGAPSAPLQARPLPAQPYAPVLLRTGAGATAANLSPAAPQSSLQSLSVQPSPTQQSQTPQSPVQQMADLLRQPLAEQQSGLGSLFSQMGALSGIQAAGKAPVPDAVTRAMQQILGLRLNSASSLSGQDVQQAVRLSGQFREGQLAQPGSGLPLPDLKSALMSFRSLLQGLGAQEQTSRPAGQPAVPLRRGAPQGQPQLPSGSHAAGTAAQNMQSLLQETDAALARLRATQLVNSGLTSDDGPPTSSRPMDVVMELPLALGQDTAVMQMQIGRDGGGGQDDDEGEPSWRLRFALDLTATGPLEAAVSLRGGGTFASLWVDRKETFDTLSGLRTTMEAAFADAGLDLQEFRLIRGLPPKAAARHGALIDRQS